ncbi:recombinase family protein [Nonomuraea sp. NPDC050310]|uniref:recombinase family protein n=1 Tax=Nonomuraea sp. NPDC050310 TaxID=3154935 RepID=UPI0033DA8FC8
MFDAPIDLSDLPGYQASTASRPRTAFLGRCSTKDNQDPRSSLAGQLAEASLLLGPGEAFVAHFWDVESGMLGLDERSQISAEDYARLGVPVPRDGGLGELLEAVERGEVDRVACERIGRVARDMLPSLQIERHLLSRGVPIDCASFPAPNSRPPPRWPRPSSRSSRSPPQKEHRQAARRRRSGVPRR